MSAYNKEGSVSAEDNKAGVRRYFEEFHDRREHGILEEIVTRREDK